ncbi:MAG TPA: hypothetical protein VGN32_03395 [Ktedonobacterales bacterium]|jgi:hypothetical protein|nr:hypothetical protein [Ktedonobacterales bacterium]
MIRPGAQELPQTPPHRYFRKDWVSLGAPILFLAIFVGLLALRWADAKPLLALVGM